MTESKVARNSHQALLGHVDTATQLALIHHTKWSGAIVSTPSFTATVS